ncbi:TonB-dependent receptor [Vibrio sp. AND4]|uniref:TonB-dependent receptor domain-containing protein n=1 Tax=Vibrio sp. AND4 TaxID=314289 RepID=UPI00015F1A25|nr:TonB-dependent receptor [Vibrio sp. AND4]EDP57803.1 putaive Fe-regulated protein B precursor [Vibrio sp. AND4]
MTNKTYLAVLIAATFSANSIATENDGEKVTVWGTQISNSSESLLASDIEMKQGDHLSDLLRDQPGVDVGGTHSLNQGVNIRGVSELDLDITLDGASQNNNVFHHAGNLLINADIIKAVDIRVGNNSVLNSGLGGGVAFETKDARDLLRGDDKFGTRIFSGMASNDYSHTSAAAFSELSENVDALVYYSVISRDNPKDGDGNEVLGRDGKTQNVLAKVGWDANDQNRFELSYDYLKDAGDYTIKSNMGMNGSNWHEKYIRPIEYTRDTVALNHELALANTDVHSTLYYNEMSYTSKRKGAPINEGRTEVYGLKVLSETNLEVASMLHTVRYGLEGKTEESKELLGGKPLPNSKETAKSFALYVEDEIQLTQDWSVTPGARYNRYKVDMLASDKTFKDTIFGLSSKYILSKNWSIQASGTELFKGPALSGSFLTSSSSYNPDLKPETGVNYEASIAYQNMDLAGLDTLGFSLTVFNTQINDYIDDTMTGKASPTKPYRNLGDVDIVGFESAMILQRDQFNGRLTYAHSDSEFKNVALNSGLEKGQSLEDEVGDSISLNLGYTFPSVGVDVNWTSLVALDLKGKVNSDSDKKGYNVHGINMRWIPTTNEDVTVTASVDNIFDAQYASHASHDFGYIDYEPGRNVQLSLAYQF